MKPYKKVDVSEQQLEDLVRRHTSTIEEGLGYVDHQKQAASGRLDVLMVDSGKALVVAELKVVQDDGMLMQGVDYYDYVSSHVEAFARLYKAHLVDPTQEVRLFLIAPSFSQILINRCKWLNLPISLFTYNCLKFDEEEDLVPIFSEQAIPTPPEVIEVTQLDDHLTYITDPGVRSKVSALLDEIKSWKPGNISLDSIKYAISMKVNGRVFAYFYPRRKHYILATYTDQEVWTEYIIKDDDDLANVKPIMQAAMERRMK
ncbi:MAG: DUF91 domain-containing protein [Candidatus Tectomicrobia bacterium]|uniref:DUF91 domain-containing protein n=1 Tax=Tectimicrobiota bacterium TaxID=2528274 RepID=A0A933LRC9_UNCTE|nr:DUF91 domain-containing protein [Candidatus Tectomicrobia bacterium]